jgi:hypothetical protein
MFDTTGGNTIADAFVMPSQFVHDHALTRPQHLYLAILDQWFADWKHNYHDTSTRGLRLHEEEESWLASNSTDQMCGICNVCAALDIDLEWFRKGIEQQRKHLEGGIHDTTHRPSALRRHRN